MSVHDERREARPAPEQVRRPRQITPAPRDRELPLSFAQQRLWFLSQLVPDSAAYNIPFFARLEGPLDAAVLERSLREVIQRHEALRTTFVEVKGQPVQRVAPEVAFALPVEHLEGLGAEARAQAVRRREEEEARRPFDLSRGPLLRAMLLRLAPDEHVLLLVVHHIVCDNWSQALLLSELKALYSALLQGATPNLPALPVQYVDYALWQRERMAGEALEAEVSWWKRRLAGAPPVLSLPADRPRSSAPSSRGALWTQRLPEGLGGALRELCRRESVTPFMALLAAFQVLLSRYTGEWDVVLGTPSAGRTRRDIERLIGFFAHTVVLRLEGAPELSFRELLGRVRQVCLEAQEHQELPFERLVEALQPSREPGLTPIFQVMFVLQLGLPVELPGIIGEEIPFHSGTAKFDLILSLRETPQGWVGFWDYNADLFDEATVARMGAHYARLLEGAIAEPARPMSELPLLGEEERRRVLVEWNATAAPTSSARGVQALFEETAARAPDAVAVSFGAERLTYGELNRRANRLAHHLRRLGVREDEPVGLCVKRSLELAVGVLGILKAGGAYVPLDPAYPPERLALMLDSSRARMVVTQRAMRGVLPEGQAARVELDGGAALLSGEPESNPENTSGRDALTYVIYTSGSTGVPKGVAMHHRPLLNLIRWQLEQSKVPGGRTLQFSAISFDVSFQELFSTWAAGGELVLVSEETRRDAKALLELLDERGVERLFLPFVALQQLAETAVREGPVPRALKEVITAGEQLRVTPALRRFMKRLGGVLHNQYGPTETHVATAFTLTGEPETWPDLPPIGRPIANTSIHLLDANRQPVPVGVPGELYIGGEAVARGYLHRPDLTQERFIPDPVGAAPGGRLYRTGDFARYLADGNIEYLGRRDAQVKVRGYRIELAEVEAALAKHPEVGDCVVDARADGGGQKRLVAYVVGKEGRAPSAASMRDFIKAHLPEHMVPSVFVRLDTLPLTPSGKVNRRALPAPDADAAASEGYVPPRTGMEEVVAGVWAPLLGLKRMGAHDHFFESGGHSLLATQAASRLREALGLELPVRAIFEAPTVAELAARLDAAQGAAGSRQPPLVPVPRDEALPLSFAQQRLWFITQLDPNSFAYNVPFFARLKGRLDTAALERSLEALLRRHEVLRTAFVEVNGQPVQRIAPPGPFPAPVESLESLPEDARAQAALDRAREEARRPFDLRAGPLARAKLLRVAPDEHVLLLVMHHIVCDGWSLGVLSRELGALYAAYSRGEPPALPELPVQYADFAAWQREWLAGETLEALRGYWKQQLAGAPPVLELPTDRPRPPAQSFRGALFRSRLPLALSGPLRELARAEGVTSFMTFLAAFQALLARYTGQTDLVVGSPIAGRNRREVEGLLGFFVNTLALRVAVPGDVSFRQLLARVREACLGAYAHDELPFEQLVDAVQPTRDLSRTPIFQVMFVLQEAPASLALPGLAMDVLDVDPGLAKFDLTLFVRETPSGWVCFWEYSTDLFEERTVARLAEHFAQLLGGAVAAPELRVAELPLLTAAERRQLLEEWSDGRPWTGAADATIHGLFEAQAARAPDAVALIDGARALTYAELNRRANQLANTLRGWGVGPEVPVGICARRSWEMVVGLLGILKAGGLYVPLDPTYPPSRLALVMEDAQVKYLVTQAKLAGTLPAHSARALCLDASDGVLEQASAANPRGGAAGHNLAYLIYTSGSTGRPKGVAIEHRNAVALLDWARGAFSPDLLAGTLAATSINFDLSVFELFLPLARGGTVILAENALELSRLPAADRVVLVNTVPSAMAELLRAGNLPAGVRVVNLAGEPLPTSLVRQLYERPGIERVNDLYGPSETTTYSTHAVRRADAPATIGRAIAGTGVYLLDAWLNLVPAGVPGEIYIGGAGVARGYLNRPDLTAERFMPDPFSQAPGARMYRTGDLARYLPDGQLEYLGRRDFQVKVRGFRIELGEVEAALGRHPGVREVVVSAREDGPGGKRLVAYLVPRAGHEAEPATLRRFLKEKLPEHMVPSAFVRLEKLPLTPNGKVDRKALPAPEADAPAREGDGAPLRTPMEELVASIWAPLLGRERVGARDNFFDLGGHSLLGAQVVSRVREVLRVELSVRVLFEAPTLGELAQRLEALVGQAPEQQAPPLVPVPRDGELTLSFAQLRLWFLDRFEPGGFAYNVPYALRLKGALDVASLERGLEGLVARHEALRTTFAELNGQPVQRIASSMPCPVQVEELGAVPEAERAGAVQRWLEHHARRPFDLERGPLLRASLLRVAADEHVLLLNLHHIASDIWSLGLLLRELGALYEASSRGAEPALPALPIQYADYAAWQRAWLKGEVLEAQLAWWKEHLRGAPPVLELPVDRPRPPAQTFRGAHLAVPLPAALGRAVQELSRKEGVTLFMTYLAAFQALLARYTGEPDVVVGSPVIGRNRRELEGLIGCFLNTLVLRAEVASELGFRALLRRVREVCLGAYAHQELPFEQLVDALQPVRDMARTPLFQVMFVYQNALPPVALPGVSAAEQGFESGMAKFDLTLFVRETADGWVSVWEYNTDLFDEATAARLGAHYARLLEGAVAEPARPMSELPLLGEEERRRVLVEWNATAAPTSSARGVQALFEETAARAPDAAAVSFGAERLTYGELNRRANRLAHHLRRLGVREDEPVGLCVKRSLELAVGVLGILKAGGAYVPLDPAYPPERLALMLASSRARVLLTQTGLREVLPAGEVSALCLDAGDGAFAGEPESNPENTSGRDALAYVIYTSGSTGVPKGVAMHHRPLLNLIRWQLEQSKVPGGRTLQFSAISFDVSFQELFSTWAAGGELVLVSEETRRDAKALLELLDERGVERLFLPFVALQNLAETAVREGPVPRALKEVITAGEQLRVTPALRRFMKRLGGVLHNQYGPTETHVATAFTLTGEPETWPDLPPIGRPIANTSIHLLDANRQPVPVGVPGELYIGGEAVARGYLHRPDLTQERFIPDPVGAAPGGRLYRTGDFARYLADGNIEYLGRRDAQVKVRGYRIELAEVEAALAKHPEVGDCVVDARADGGGQKRLVAYVVGKEGRAPSAASMRDFIKAHLPEHMVPSVFVRLDTLPLTPSGKVNRRALPAPDATHLERSRALIAPRNGLELQLVRVWEEVLGVHPVGVQDNFFELGGHSLMAVRLLSRIRASTGRSLPVAALFQHATVEGLAGALRREPGPWSPLVELQGGSRRTPFFCVHAVGGTALSYVELARLLGPEQPFYGLQAPGLEGEQPPFDSIPALATLYVEALKTVQPRGPYLLGGWSMGGSIAYEMAQLLQRQGEQVALLALFDSYASLIGGDYAPPARHEATRLAALFYRELLSGAGQPLPLSEDALAKLGPEEQRRALEEAGLAAAAQLGIGPEALRALRQVFESNLRAAWWYVPRAYAGRVALFEASESAAGHGWERLVTGGLEVHRVPGNHHSLLRHPNVEALAAQLKLSMEQALASDTSPARTRHAAAT